MWKSGVRRIKDTWKMKKCANKQENIFVYVYWNGIGVPVWTWVAWMKKIQWKADHKAEDFCKERDVIWLFWLLLHVLVWCQDTLHEVLQLHIDLKETVNHNIHHLEISFRELVVSWCLCTTMSESYLSSSSLNTVSSSIHKLHVGEICNKQILNQWIEFISCLWWCVIVFMWLLVGT